MAKNTVPWRGRNVCQRCDTCSICPTGAKYSPDFSWMELGHRGSVEMIPGTLVRRIETEAGSGRIERAVAVSYERPSEEVELRARVFVLAAGYVWSPHLLLLSPARAFPTGSPTLRGWWGTT